MGIPSAPNPARQRLTGLRNALLHLHKILLDCERAAYETDVAKITSTGQMLQLLINDPHFDWLHRISELIVDIDERLDDKKNPAGDADAAGYIAQARALLVPAENGNDFGRRYDAAMQREPDVILAHGRMMAAIAAIE
jgi:hypothetical protein